MMRSILQYLLKILAQIVLWRYQPEIVAVTGSAGKTSTKEAIYHVLRKQFRVRRNFRNYNNEIGVPLTILGIETGGRSFLAWLNNFLKVVVTILWEKSYPEILVLEMGVDRPGDMRYLVDFIPVKVGVITAIGQFPTHVEFFPEKGKLVEEKALLVKSLVKGGSAVLNYDDLTVRIIGDDLPERTKIIHYGFGQGADLKIFNYQFGPITSGLTTVNLEKGDFGVSFKLDYQGSVVPVKLNRVLGKQQAYATAAATAVGLHFGLNLVEISAALRKYRSLPGRTNLIKGIKGTWIIDDSYNASPSATIAALEILEEFPLAGGEEIQRKIAVLGDMLELGKETETGHRQVGQKVTSVVNLLFTVGSRARFIAEEARQQGLAPEKIFEFSLPEKAARAVQEELTKRDVILVKGSRAIHMEKVVREIMAHPEKAEKLLVEG